MYRKLIPLAFAIVLLVGIAPQKAAAYTYWFSAWHQETQTYTRVYACFSGFPGGDYGSRANLWMEALDNWNNETAQLDFYEAANRDCSGDGNQNHYHIKWGCPAEGCQGAPARTTVDNSFSSYAHEDATTWVNPDFDNIFWWSFDIQSCINYGGGVGCKLDAVAAAIHEAGHSLGLGHDPTGIHCRSGYSFEYANLACDSGATHVMYEAATDGYRRRITSDDRTGARLVYGYP